MSRSPKKHLREVQKRLVKMEEDILAIDAHARMLMYLSLAPNVPSDVFGRTLVLIRDHAKALAARQEVVSGQIEKAVAGIT